jgi:hypothetical protein
VRLVPTAAYKIRDHEKCLNPFSPDLVRPRTAQEKVVMDRDNSVIKCATKPSLPTPGL